MITGEACHQALCHIDQLALATAAQHLQGPSGMLPELVARKAGLRTPENVGDIVQIGTGARLHRSA